MPLQKEQRDGQGIVRPPRRPPGWRPPGPPAPDLTQDPALLPRVGEDLCWLVGNWRILQRLDGHRWSLDDLVTAWAAIRWIGAPPARVLDLGCGIGSVLLMLAWAFPGSSCTGIEAQEISLDLARRSIALAGITQRCRVLAGDLRDFPGAVPATGPAAGASSGCSDAVAAGSVGDAGQGFELVTGTPPYLPLGSAPASDRPQRGPCRLETRGGVEVYCAAAARSLAADGWFVTCAGGTAGPRVEAAAAASGLTIERELMVEPRAGKRVLFGVWGLRRASRGERAAAPPLRERLVVRTAEGGLSAAFEELRRDMGLPPRQSRP